MYEQEARARWSTLVVKGLESHLIQLLEECTFRDVDLVQHRRDARRVHQTLKMKMANKGLHKLLISCPDSP